jgi:triacylglycerol lipase
MRSVVKRYFVAVAAAVALVGLLPAPAHARPYTAASNPILFVHGWGSSAATWNTMVNRFRADGWPANYLRAFSYPTYQSNATTADAVRREVDQLLAATGKSKVDIITHSMGGLSSRYYTKNLHGDLQVDRWVSLGGPNHGTTSANLCVETSCREMRVGSAFLAGLNSGDETPGVAVYGTWWSACDGVIYPPDSPVLAGARNTQAGCVGHNSLHTDATIYGQVRDFVNP